MVIAVLEGGRVGLKGLVRFRDRPEPSRIGFFLSFFFSFFFLFYAFSLIAHVLTSTLFRWQKVRRHYR